MDETYSWHKGADGVNVVWPVSVHLQSDEIFSSWLVRAALSQGCDPLVLTGTLWPGWRVWTIDPDRIIDAGRLKLLSKSSGISGSNFRSASLFHVISKIAPDNFENNSVWPWVLTLGSRNRRRRGGLQYCPLCLAEDKWPYYRIQWRFAWHTCCLKHKIWLFDRCSNCNAPVEPHRLTYADKDVAYCASCNFNLRYSTGVTCDDDVLSFQEYADSVIKEDCGYYDGGRIDRRSWFELSRFFLTLLRKASAKNFKGLNNLLCSIGIKLENVTPPRTGLSFELLPNDERALLLSNTWALLKTEIESLIEYSKQYSLSASSWHDIRQPYPACLSRLFLELQEKPIRRNKKKTANIGPRSRLAVTRMYERLKRKYQL